MRSVENSAAQISCLLLPMNGTNFLLPNTSVAEIIEFTQPSPVDGAPQWFAGHIVWRGRQVPLVLVEALNEAFNEERHQETKVPDPVDDRYGRTGRIAVTNGVGPHNVEQPFIAFATRGLPRLVKVRQEEITGVENADEDASPMVSMRVNFSGEDAIIPDLEYMEQRAFEALQPA